MPEPLTSYILEWRTCYLQLNSEFNNLYNDTIDLKNQLTAEGNPNSGNAANNMAVHIWNIKNWFMGQARSLRNVMYDSMHYVDLNIGGGAAVDMDAIINAMLAADFDELQKFIGIVDAYRLALWNAPFNAEFYAALAQGFIKWPQY